MRGRAKRPPLLQGVEKVELAAVEYVMDYCNNYFAVLCERITGASVDSKTIEATFKGKYTPGALVRIHGAFSTGYGDFGEGAVYEVEAFEDGVLTLNKPLHTIAPNLFIAYLEPPAKFLDLCAEIGAYKTANAGREGLQSESIDGYSWSGASTGTGWASVFDSRLREYKQPRPTMLYYARDCLQWR